mgnify:CR=1 FL=1
MKAQNLYLGSPVLTSTYRGKSMKKIDVELIVSAGKIRKVLVKRGNVAKELPVEAQGIDATPENMRKIEEYLKELSNMGVGVYPIASFEDIVKELTPGEKAIIKRLSSDRWIKIKDLARAIGAQDTREIAGLTAQITRRCRKYGIIGPDETIIEKRLNKDSDELEYRLRPEFEGLRTIIE